MPGPPLAAGRWGVVGGAWAGDGQSLSAMGLASLSSVLRVHDWSCVGPGVSTPLLLSRFLRPSYVSLSQGTPLPKWLSPPSSQSFWGLYCKPALEWRAGAEGQSQDPQVSWWRRPRRTT